MFPICLHSLKVSELFYCLRLTALSFSGTTCSGGAPSQLTSTFIAQCLKSGDLQHHIRYKLRTAYATRYQKLMNAIETHLLPLGFQLPQVDREMVGGYFIWLSLPEVMSATVLASRCKDEQNLIIAAGKIFEVPGDDTIKFESSVRICWAWEREEVLEEGVRRIGVVAKKMLASEENEEIVVAEEERDVVAEFK